MYLGRFALKVLKVVVGNCGDGATASRPAAAATRAHRVEVLASEVTALVVGCLVAGFVLLALVFVLYRSLYTKKVYYYYYDFITTVYMLLKYEIA